MARVVGAGEDLDAAIASMLKLNRDAATAAQAAQVVAATDITGYGLLGHGVEMALPARRAIAATRCTTRPRPG